MRKTSAVRMVLGGLLLAIAAAPLRAQTAVSTVSCQALRLMLLKRAPHLLIIDVRPPENFAQSHIEDAVNVPYSAVASSPIAKGQDIVVYCNESTCPLSTDAVKTLMSRGYPDVLLLDGGFNEWQSLHYPVQGTAGSARWKECSVTDLALLLSQNSVILTLRPYQETDRN